MTGSGISNQRSTDILYKPNYLILNNTIIMGDWLNETRKYTLGWTLASLIDALIPINAHHSSG